MSPKLQVGGQVVTFLHDHLGMPIVSPAVFEQIGTRFRQAVARFAERQRHPGDQVQEGRPEDRCDATAAAAGRPGWAGRSVVAIGWAQEFQLVWTARKRDTDPAKPPQFSFAKTERRVTCYYFYVWDEGSGGPAFIKVCAYFPYPVKVWLNGHEHAKRAAARAGIGFTELSNGFACCDDPDGLQLTLRPARAGRHPGVLRPVGVAVIPVPLTAGRPGGRVLVGTVAAAGRGVPDPGASTRPARPGRSSRR